MNITGLNHITLSVSDLERSLAFYQQLLGFELRVSWQRGAYLTAGHLWLCLSLGQPKPAQDYSHLALTVAKADFPDWQQRLAHTQVELWQSNSSEGDSLYCLDPDGHQWELHAGDLANRLASLVNQPYAGLVWH